MCLFARLEIRSSVRKGVTFLAIREFVVRAVLHEKVALVTRSM